MLSILLIPSVSLFNRIRGGLFPNLSGGRFIASALVGGAYALATMSYINGAAVMIGYLLWALPGWGLYMAAATGEWGKYETEIRFIDRLGIWLVPFVTSVKNWSNFRRGVICMGMRGGIYSLPLFGAIAYLVSPWALAIWPAFFLQGAAYFVAGRIMTNTNPIGFAEWAWGACIGAMLLATTVLN